LDIKTSLIIKYNDANVSANLMVGDHVIAHATEESDFKKAISKVLNQYRDGKSVSKVVISKDFTKGLEIDDTLDEMLYVRILPIGDSWQKKEACFSGDGDISSKVKALNLEYNQEGEYTNFLDIKKYIDATSPKSIALNYVHTTKFSNIEFEAYNVLKREYPEILIYPSTNLFNRNFIVRGNTQLLNLVLTPKISHFIENLKNYLFELAVDAPLYFLRTNKGVVGQDTILTQGVDTHGCEEFLHVSDSVHIISSNDALLADFTCGYLYHIKNKMPVVSEATIDLADSKILGFAVEKHTLDAVLNESQFEKFLDKRTPHRGPMPMYMLGAATFDISDFFSYPIRFMSNSDCVSKGSLNSMIYRTEAEVFIGQSDNIDIGRAELVSILVTAATADGLCVDEKNCSSVLVPMKYLKNKVYMLRMTLEAEIGV